MGTAQEKLDSVVVLTPEQRLDVMTSPELEETVPVIDYWSR